MLKYKNIRQESPEDCAYLLQRDLRDSRKIEKHIWYAWGRLVRIHGGTDLRDFGFENASFAEAE